MNEECTVSATVKRFYRQTNVLKGNGKYEIILDQRKLKTPKGNIFSVESEPLALAVATEWDSQKDKIMRSQMHIVGFQIFYINTCNFE